MQHIIHTFRSLPSIQVLYMVKPHLLPVNTHKSHTNASIVIL